MWSHQPLNDEAVRCYRIFPPISAVLAVATLGATAKLALNAPATDQFLSWLTTLSFCGLVSVVCGCFSISIRDDLKLLVPGELAELCAEVQDDQQSYRLLAKWVADRKVLRKRDKNYLLEMKRRNYHRKLNYEVSVGKNASDRVARDALLRESND